MLRITFDLCSKVAEVHGRLKFTRCYRNGIVTDLGSFESGGDDGIRTHDLCSAIAALSQLSYIPKEKGFMLPFHPLLPQQIDALWS